MSSPALTAGCLAVSLAIAGTNGWHWYKRGRKPEDLAHFGSGVALGGLSTVCGGLLGTLAGWSIAAGNSAGSSAVSGTTGATATAIRHGTAGHLTPGGGIITCLLAVGCVVAWRAAGKEVRRRLVGGFFVGATLVATAGMAHEFVHVVGLVNSMGDPLIGWFNRGQA